MPNVPKKIWYPSKYHQVPDVAYDETERILAEMIAEIESVYGQAYVELHDKADAYLAWFTAEDVKQREMFQDGIITAKEYQNWRMRKMFEGRHWFAMAETMAMDLSNSNGIAMSIISSYLPEVYALNGNWTAYQIEKATTVNMSFELFDEQTIERLIREHPDLLPKPSVNIPLDMQWNKQNLQSAVIQSILQGESVDQCADRLAAVTDMNQSSAIRNAKTMVTSAQNGGRQDCYERAESMGIKMLKRWLATLDGHTRASHRALDGVAIPVDETFDNGCEFPGDPNGEPAEVYNCRCRTISEFPDQDFSKFERNSRLGDMSYDDWKDAHGGEPIFKKARNANRDYDMMREYRKLLGKRVPTNIKDFQNIKYNNPQEWAKMKSDARKERNRRRNNGF